ncbi:hypothetical protein BBFL7_02095 [Flavobacteria bacterium BBFL7]|nr:hypothetical protein BBFL7_02095 [Flavobacteria bacterium BBFL7]
MDKLFKDEYFNLIHENVAKFGFHITYVMEEKGFTPFGYSTGIYQSFGIPELFISGLPSGLTNELIKNYVEKFKFKKVLVNQKIDYLTNRFPVYFITVQNELLTDYALSSFSFYKDSEFKYVQLIFPDLKGRFPDESQYNYDQEIIK